MTTPLNGPLMAIGKICLGGMMLMFLTAEDCASSTKSPLVIIHYSQSANFYVLDTDPTGSPHRTISVPDAIYVIFCIRTIKNQDADAHNFTFDLSKVYVNSDPDSFPGTSFDYLVQTTPSTLAVLAHSTSLTVGRFAISVSGGALNPAAQAYNLLYNSSIGESVLFVRDDFNNPLPVQVLAPASPVHPNNLPTCS